MAHPKEFYEFYKSKMVYPKAKPNAAHRYFAKLEEEGKLSAIVTQNIDGLHQAAGSKTCLNFTAASIEIIACVAANFLT